MLGEAATTEITQQKDSKGFDKLRDDAKTGGGIAGRARKDIEEKAGKRVVTKENFLINKKNSVKKLDDLSE